MRYFILTCKAMLVFSMLEAQINTSFSFGSLGAGSMETSSFTGPLAFEGANDCLTLKNGVIVMTRELKTGTFNLGCKVKLLSSSSSVNVFPNPLNGHVIVQSDAFVEGDEVVKAVLLDGRGRLIAERTLKGKEIYAGYRMDMQQVANGLYLLKLISNDQVHIFKIIKTGNIQ